MARRADGRDERWLTTVLAVGGSAPDFSLKDQNNQRVSLAIYAGQQDVLLVFYPLPFTGGCQRELDEIRDRSGLFIRDDVATLAISVAPSPIHKAWAAGRGYTVPLLSDFWPHGAVSQAYGVFNAKTGLADRGTFVVDRRGTIRFAECQQPGEVRDPAVWSRAISSLTA